jgi:hypothetical protein
MLRHFLMLLKALRACCAGADIEELAVVDPVGASGPGM